MWTQLLEKVRENVQLESVYRLDLEGKVHDPARGFIEMPLDAQVGQGEDVQVIGRTLLVPIRDEQKQIQEIARVVLVLMTPTKDPGGWRMFLGAKRPWTVQMAQYVIRGNLGPADAFNNGTGLFVPGQVYRYGPGFEGAMIGHVWAPENKTLGVFAHAADRPTLMKHRRNLERLAPAYRDLLHIALYDDPRSAHRAHYVSHDFYGMTGRKIDVQLPPVGGITAVFPKGFPEELIPKDFPLRLTKKDATDSKKLEPWLEQLAALRIDPRWAKHDMDEWVDALVAPSWKEDLARDSAAVLFEQVEALENERLKNIKKMQHAMTLVDELRTHGAARAEELVRVREQMAVAQSAERELRARNKAQENELKQLRALDAAQLMAQRDEAQEQLREVKAQLAQNRDALLVLREHVSQDGLRLDELMPDTWPQVYQLALIFQRVEVPDWAVQPAYGVLDRGQEAASWLRRTWLTLLKLEEYARVKAAGARGASYVNFWAFVKDFGSEYVTEKHVTLSESATVQADPVMRRSRTFDTPSGPQFFEAHVDIGSGKPPAPRLHFWDDTDGPSGKVFVGYVGPHLKNKSTN